MQHLKAGTSAEWQRTVTAESVELFAEATGDANPIHLDDKAASETRFGRRIAHGMLAAGYISAVLGTKLPGPGSIYLSQHLRFRAPVFLGDVITTRVEVIDVRADKPIVTLRTTCTNQDGVVVTDGEAIVLAPS
jgi:acyl dehydratase